MEKTYFKKIRNVMLMLFSILILSSNYLSAQTRSELTVADGGTTNSLVPFWGMWMDAPQKTQSIYTANMISEMAGDTIKEIVYYGNNPNKTWNSIVTISLGITTLDDLSQGWATDALTDVYTGTLSTNDNSEIVIIFQNPFYYEGGNLVVQLESPEGANYTNCTFYGDIIISASRSVKGTDYATASGMVHDFIPKVTFNYGAPPTCIKPDNLNVKALTFNSVTLEWNEVNAATEWNIEYGLKGFTPGSGTIINADANPYTIENLDSNTEYSFRVQTVCDPQDQSDWTSIVNATTLCAPVELPFIENFENINSYMDFPPQCWERLSGLAEDAFQGIKPVTVSYGWGYVKDFGIDGNHMKINIWGSSRRHWILTPVINLEEEATLTFDLALTAYGSNNPPSSTDSDDKFMVVIITDGGNTYDIANATIWDNAKNNSLANIPNTAQKITIDLAQYVGQQVRIGFYGESTVSGADFDIHVGNINVKKGVPQAPSSDCIPPSDLVYTVDTNDITMSWTAPNYVTTQTKVILSENFETIPDFGMLPDWQTIDADGDGHSWEGIYDNKFAPGLNDSKGLVASGSWENNQSLSPDNYLITPMITEEPVKVNFFVRAQSENYPAEHYAVMVSTTGTDATDFTTVFEETLTAKKSADLSVDPSRDNPGQWYERNVDLPAGVKYIAFRHFNSVDQYQINIDSLTIEAIDYPTITYNVYANDNIVAQGLYETNYSKEDLANGDYVFCVAAVYNDTCISDKICTEQFNVYVPPCDPVINLTADVYADEVNLTWEPPINMNLPYGVIFQEDFETIPDQGMFDNWITIDADGDGHSWEGIYDNKFVPGYNDSKGLIGSGSWEINQALSPDNYIITPNVNGAIKIHYFVRAQSETYPSEHYALMASTSGTDVADFTTVHEETLTAAKGIQPSGNPTRDYPGVWFERTVDLPVGTQYVAFRHFDTQDQYQINIDSIRIEAEPRPDITYNVYQNDSLISQQQQDTTIQITGLPNGTYTFCVEAVWADTCISWKECVDVVIDVPPCDPVINLTAVEVNGGVLVSWEEPPGYATIGVVYEQDFETIPDFGMLPDWQTIDADGDGHAWEGIYDNKFVPGHNNSLGLVGSGSWENNQSLSPDNYLISPVMYEATNIQYYVRAQSQNYPAEHYALMVSSTGTNAADFTTVYEETLTAKGAVNNIIAEDNNRDYPGAWYLRDINLPAGTKYIAFRHFNSEDQYQINIDDITVTGVIPPDITYNVYQDDVQLVDHLDSLSYFVSNLPNGTYTFCVEAVYADTCISLQECVEITVTNASTSCEPVTNLTATTNGNNVSINWGLPVGVTGLSNIILSEDFEAIPDYGMLAEWTIIDADGDGRNWYGVNDNKFVPGYNNSLGLVASESWIDAVGINPDNYMITPDVTGGTNLSFVVRAQSENFSQEHYAVMVSSTGTNATDFTIVFEETLTAKGNVDLTADRSRDIPGQWFNRSVDLPAGTKYVAFRHYNCSDAYQINIDNVIIGSGTMSDVTYNVYQDGNSIATGINTLEYLAENLAAGTYNFCVEAVYPDGCVSPQECVDVTVDAPVPPIFAPVNNLAGTVNGSDVTLTWEAPGKGRDVILSEDFETILNGTIPDGWAVIDADGDGKNWEGKYNVDYISGNNNSLGLIVSYSYQGGVLNPDNYLITPNVEGATEVTYYIASHNSWPAEHYAIMASSTGTDAADFTIVFEETLSNSKGSNSNQMLNKDSQVPDRADWSERNIEIPAGTKYIAFRHYDCSNELSIRLDDVTVTGGAPTPPPTDIVYNVYQNGTQIANGLVETTYTHSNVANGDYTYCVEAVYTDGISPQECVDVNVDIVRCNPVIDLSIAEVDNDNIMITWDYPLEYQNSELQGYSLYISNTLIGTINDADILNYQLDKLQLRDDATICVTAVYEQCESSSECIDAGALGINDAENVSIYPNPAKDIVNITGIEVDVVYIYNNAGQLVGKVNSNSVDVSQYASGMYLFSIVSVDGTIYKEKVLVK